MSTTYLHLTAHDPLVARDGRPFGINQGQRMRGLPWLLPSVVAGSFRTALVKANPGLDFSWQKFKQEDLLKIEVAGVFPVLMESGKSKELFLPAPNDAVAEPQKASKEIKRIHRVRPWEVKGCCDFPEELPLWPVMLPDGIEDFKPADMPAWWPLSKIVEWLTLQGLEQKPEWFKNGFLNAPTQAVRDHVALEAERGAAEEGKIFASSNLHLTHLPRYGVKLDDRKLPLDQRYAEVALSARVKNTVSELQNIGLKFWHPLGGERRLIQWQQCQKPVAGWTYPPEIRTALANTKKVRMILATPAIFSGGWKPGWLNNGLEGELFGVKLKLVGVCNGRWKAVSGWSLQPLPETGRPGPKPIRRMVPAGSVYFFEKLDGDASSLADRWLQPVSDDPQESHDGFGLALWGTW